jgi:hypothetical protein
VIKHRKPKKKGEKDKKRGTSNLKIAVVVAQESNDKPLVSSLRPIVELTQAVRLYGHIKHP